ncbi:MAG: hypothetical protein LBV41_03765 [Cytophagaceae bacterium]|nr:hypothetical protein [Cytophagaceae bacterium]
MLCETNIMIEVCRNSTDIIATLSNTAICDIIAILDAARIEMFAGACNKC